jgi:hypothetical protein
MKNVSAFFQKPPRLVCTLDKFKEVLWFLCHHPNGEKPYVEVLFTPEIVNWILKHRNQSNRNVNWARVQRLTHDIKNKDFKLIHQGVAFKKNGGLADGQHRFYAIQGADEAVSILTMFNLDPRELFAVDEGSRSDVDIWNLMLHSILDNLPNGAQAVFKPFFYHMGIYFKGITPKERLAYIYYYQDSLYWAANNIIKKGDGKASIKGAFARCHAAGLDPDKMLECWELFKEGKLTTGKNKTKRLTDDLRFDLREKNPANRIKGLSTEYYRYRYPRVMVQCECMEVLLHYYVNGKINKLRSFKTGVDLLRAGKLHTVYKITHEEKEKCLKDLKDSIMNTEFCYEGMEEYRDRKPPHPSEYDQ